jgi:hypothetical protein
MDAASLREQWRRWYDKAPPLGHVMREQHPERWLRIHSLPESRRYASSPSDWTELLARHNTVATALLGDGEPCLLFAVRFAAEGQEMPEPFQDEMEALLGVRPTSLGRAREGWPGQDALKAHDYEVDAVWLLTTELRWQRGGQDPLLRVIANDELRGVLFAAQETGRVYAPYDGGADLFFRTPEERDAARERYRAWLSRHPAGL